MGQRLAWESLTNTTKKGDGVFKRKLGRSRQTERQTGRQIVRSFRQNEQLFASGPAGL